MKAVAEVEAPSLCLRVVVDRLRRQSFMKYSGKAWLGNPSSPSDSLVATDVQSCLAGKRRHPIFAHSSNCRYYVGCALRLMRNFTQIPGVSPALANLCSEVGRNLKELDAHWMHEDNKYWFSPAGAAGWAHFSSVKEYFQS